MLLKTRDSNQNESKGVDDWELAALGRKIMIGQLSTRIELMDLQSWRRLRLTDGIRVSFTLLDFQICSKIEMLSNVRNVFLTLFVLVTDFEAALQVSHNVSTL